jgi:WD40 repeat protein
MTEGITNPNTPTLTTTITDNQELTAVAFSPDGHTLVTTTDAQSEDGGKIQLWDVE